jgi:hypothetical protein
MRALWGTIYVLGSVWLMGLILGVLGSPIVRLAAR